MTDPPAVPPPGRGEHTLILLRHAKSDWSGDEADVDRPLAGRGRRQAPQAGRWLAAHAPPIDLAVVSPARRARDTWRLVAAELDTRPPRRIEDRLYAASGHELLEVLHDMAEEHDCVVLVGHNPGFEELAAQLAGQGVPMPTSALAVFTVAGSWSSADQASAVLRAAGRPPAR